MDPIELITKQIQERDNAVVFQLRDLETKLAEAKAKNLELIGRVTECEQEISKKQRNGGPAPIQSAGETVINSAEFKSFGGSRTRGRFSVEVKNIVVTTGAVAGPEQRPSIAQMPQQRLVVRDLLTVATTGSNAIEFPLQTARDFHASVVTEASEKSQSDLSFELRTAPIRTLAHWTKASKQALDDAGQLQTVVDSELRYGLGLLEESEILFGDSTGSHLNGIVTQASSFSSPLVLPGTPSRLDLLLGAIAQVQLSLLPCSGIVLNDLDLQGLRSIKDSQGRYVDGTGPFGGAITTIWGVPTVGTPSMPRGDFLCGAFRAAATLFDRMQATVLISTENSDDFIKNLVTILGEERIGLTVTRPTAFVSGEFGTLT
jgi:HK97 family phage major capsid protein